MSEQYENPKQNWTLIPKAISSQGDANEQFFTTETIFSFGIKPTGNNTIRMYIWI